MYEVEKIKSSLLERPFPEINTIVREIARNTKKAPLSSGQNSYSDYCQKIAENLVKAKNNPIIEKYKLYIK